MIKLLIVISIILIVFWMGKKSAGAPRKEVQKRDSDETLPVIDIEPED